MRRTHLLSLAVLCLLFCPLPMQAAGPVANADLAAYADHLLAAAIPADHPGAAVLVARGGDAVLRKGYGMANLELGVAVQPDDVFEIGSVTKQFTAASILLLQERGQLRVEDEITKYLPDFPTHGEKITIENLLTHTSGIVNYTGLPEWIGRVREDMPLPVLMGLFKDKPLDFKPGTRMSYSNSGYIVLGAIIEKVSGRSYEQFVEEEIFHQLGMSRSRYNHPEEIVPHRATGYGRAPQGYRNAAYLSMTQPYAAGSLLSTVDDLAKWDQALLGDALLAKASRDRMFTPFTLSSRKATGYGYGWGIYDFAGRQVIEHNGGIFGFSADEIRLPGERLFVAVLSNDEDLDTSDLAFRIVAKALGQGVEDRTSIPLDPKTLDDYVGVYRFDDEDATRFITREGDRLFSQRSGGDKKEIVAAARDEFFFKDLLPATLRFQRDARGKVTGAVFKRYNSPEQAGRKTDEPLPPERKAIQVDPARLDAYVGEYEIAPSFAITVTRQGDHLFGQPTGQPALELFPESETRFFLKEVDAQIEFIRGADGKVTGLVLHQGNRDMPGKRKP